MAAKKLLKKNPVSTIVQKPVVLVAPLDWGLGHASRCIPLICSLLKQNCTVLLAASGPTKNLLQAEFPQVRLLNLSGYEVQYASTKWLLPFSLAFQLPKIFRAIAAEKSWLKALLKSETIDAVISDNRYGLYAQGIPCVFITHQLQIQTGLGRWCNRLLQQLHYRFISRFNACWIPDVAGTPNLAGVLAHPKALPTIPVTYLGWLSRFNYHATVQPKHILVLLSGPEPQRTIFEKLLLPQLYKLSMPVVLVRGLPGGSSGLTATKNVTIYNHLPAAALQIQMSQASFIISRCGYSTLMDVLTLQKKCILVPTPGQTEQNYLANHLTRNQWAFCTGQRNFNLKKALAAAQRFPYQVYPVANAAGLHQAVQNLVLQLNKKNNSKKNLLNSAP